MAVADAVVVATVILGVVIVATVAGFVGAYCRC